MSEVEPGAPSDADGDLDPALDGPADDPGAEHPLDARELLAEETLLAQALGGWRGMIDSGLPPLVFVVVYLLDGSALKPALWSAVGVGAVVAGWRLVRRQPVQQVFAGFVGVAISAYVASRTGRAEDYFLPGLLLNVAYGLAGLVSIVVGWPLVGVVVGALQGDLTGWRQDPLQRRTFAAATWIFVAVFVIRLVVKVPLYVAGAVGALGFLSILLGWPLYLAALYLMYRVVRPVLRRRG